MHVEATWRSLILFPHLQFIIFFPDINAKERKKFKERERESEIYRISRACLIRRITDLTDREIYFCLGHALSRG